MLSCRVLIEEPDFPMKLLMSDAWQSIRSDAWPAGIGNGGGCGLARLVVVVLEERELEESDMRGRFEGGERKLLAAINEEFWMIG